MARGGAGRLVRRTVVAELKTRLGAIELASSHDREPVSRAGDRRRAGGPAGRGAERAAVDRRGHRPAAPDGLPPPGAGSLAGRVGRGTDDGSSILGWVPSCPGSGARVTCGGSTSRGLAPAVAVARGRSAGRAGARAGPGAQRFRSEGRLRGRPARAGRAAPGGVRGRRPRRWREVGYRCCCTCCPRRGGRRRSPPTCSPSGAPATRRSGRSCEAATHGTRGPRTRARLALGGRSPRGRVCASASSSQSGSASLARSMTAAASASRGRPSPAPTPPTGCAARGAGAGGRGRRTTRCRRRGGRRRAGRSPRDPSPCSTGTSGRR